MNPSEKLDRRVDSSSEISQYVYDFEKHYTGYLKDGYSEIKARSEAQANLETK